MEQQNMFEKATRKGLRFSTPKGLLNIEDVWNLPLTSTRGQANLDDLAKGLRRELREREEHSFVNAPAASVAAENLQLSFDIVKYIIDVRLAENKAANDEKERREKKSRIAELIAKKQDQALENKSLEELQALAESL